VAHPGRRRLVPPIEDVFEVRLDVLALDALAAAVGIPRSVKNAAN
jgi:hypothetical protein